MSINIPETVKKYYETEENGKAINLLRENNLIGKTLKEKEQCYKANLFVEHFLFDMWNFRYQIFKEVWSPLLEENQIKEYECDIEDADYYFVVKYEIKENIYYFGICNLAPGDDKLFMVASHINEDGQEENLGDEKQVKAYALQNREYDEEEGSCTCGEEISLKNKTEITDEEIEKFKTDAKNMMNFIKNKR